MSSQGGTSTGAGGGASSVPKKNRFGSSDDVNKSIAKRADKFAQQQLDIQKTYSGPNKQTVTGYRSGTGNQMYGALYNQSRNQYLASIGAGTYNENTGSFTAGVQTDKGLTFTDATRGAFNATRNIDIPLSKEMYKSQQKFKMAVLGGATLLSGMPSFFTAGLMSNQPYEQYVQNRESGIQRNVIQNNRTKNTKNNQNNNQTTYRQTGGDASAMEEAQKRNQKLANTAASTAASTRNFYASAGKSIKAKRISSFA